MKKMITAILCGILWFAASCFAADTPEEDLLYPVEIDGKWGYFDLTGKMVIAPNFDEVNGPFVEGFGMVVINKKYGFIDKTGKIIIAPQFDWAAGFSGGACQRERHRLLPVAAQGRGHCGAAGRAGYQRAAVSRRAGCNHTRRPSAPFPARRRHRDGGHDCGWHGT